MNLKNFVKLNESKSPGKLYHYTNEYNLIDILKTGKLKTKNYVGDKAGIKTLAVVRPSMIKNVSELSDEVGKVRFVFDIPTITSGKLRNVKIDKISEFPVGHLDDLKSYFSSMKQIHNISKKHKELGSKKFKEYLNKTNKDFSEKDINFITNELEKYRKAVINREGEERISIQSKESDVNIANKLEKQGLSDKEAKEKFLNRKDIMLDSSIMKIEMLPGFTAEVNDMDNNYKEYSKQVLKDLIRKKGLNSLFIKNNEYRKLMA